MASRSHFSFRLRFHPAGHARLPVSPNPSVLSNHHSEARREEQAPNATTAPSPSRPPHDREVSVRCRAIQCRRPQDAASRVRPEERVPVQPLDDGQVPVRGRQFRRLGCAAFRSVEEEPPDHLSRRDHPAPPHPARVERRRTPWEES